MKKNIAIVWGGYTSESVVSEKSMKGIFSFLDKALYAVYPVKIERAAWTAEADGANCPIDKNDFSFVLNGAKIKFDFACITIHGSPGEDGRLQGYFDMLGLPYSSCGMMASALTMNKYICNKYLRNFGVKTADSALFTEGVAYDDVKNVAEKLKFPLFVKPNLGGSSFATTKVKTLDRLQEAIDAAFGEAEEVIVESFLQGVEVTCGCYKTGAKITVFPLTEVVTANEFFDYDAKYNGQVDEITPARISAEQTETVQKLTEKIYGLIGAKGIIRADYIIKDGEPFLLEVNTTPGMTATSFIPQQIKAAGLNITEVFNEIIDNELKRHI
ncbi:MAG: D-alanine--D-alanine ligase [Prevotella sp.]|jgi:D-alanine-D-alanine ligase|nr:D-alanine--D-alanine ligase [Prevotella sp.]